MTAISEKSTCDRAPVLALLISSQGLTLSDYLADFCGDIHRWKWTMSKRAQTEPARSFLCWEERMGMRRETKHHFRLVSQHTFGQSEDHWWCIYCCWPSNTKLPHSSVEYHLHLSSHLVLVSELFTSVSTWPWGFKGNTKGFSLPVSLHHMHIQTCTLYGKCAWLDAVSWWCMLNADEVLWVLSWKKKKKQQNASSVPSRQRGRKWGRETDIPTLFINVEPSAHLLAGVCMSQINTPPWTYASLPFPIA